MFIALQATVMMSLPGAHPSENSFPLTCDWKTKMPRHPSASSGCGGAHSSSRRAHRCYVNYAPAEPQRARCTKCNIVCMWLLLCALSYIIINSGELSMAERSNKSSSLFAVCLAISLLPHSSQQQYKIFLIAVRRLVSISHQPGRATSAACELMHCKRAVKSCLTFLSGFSVKRRMTLFRTRRRTSHLNMPFLTLQRRELPGIKI